MDSIAIEDARVRAAMDFYLLDLEGTAPKNTVKNYAPKQAEWKVRLLLPALNLYTDATVELVRQ
jgi:hypothetical protein